MATVAEILNIASKVTGLRAEAGGAETDIALAAINNAYLRAVLDAELVGEDAEYTVTASADTIKATAVAQGQVYRVQHLRLLSAGTRVPLQQVSRQEIQDYRAVEDVQGLPAFYSVAMVAGEPKIDFYPPVGKGDQLKMSYLLLPEALTTGTDSIAYLPDMFHHDLLTNAAIAALFERDGALDKAELYRARSLETISRIEEYLGQMGGNANRAYTPIAASRASYPDQRGR